jgi:hypothetical protein
MALLIPATSAFAATLLSQGKPAWATSQTSTNTAARANDGSASTRWQAATRAFPAKWQVDLGAQKALGPMTIQWPSGARFSYTIAGSNDKARYVQLASGTGADLTSKMLTGSYRYVLVTVTASSTGSTPAVLEAKVFSSDGIATTPTPLPSVTPTATPTTTPIVAPAPSTGGTRGPQATSAPATTINNMVLSSGQSNVTYDNVTFTGGTSSSAVVTITRASNITFRNCTFSKGGGWNSVSINDNSGSVRNITFDNCRWVGAGRMNIEITSRPTSASSGYQGINITDSILEPSGNESVSYDGGPAAGGSLFQNNLIKGAGTNPSAEWGSGLEINGSSNMTVKNNEIWQVRDFAFNFQRHTTAASGWVVQNNTLDATKRAQTTAQRSDKQQVLCLDVRGGSFTGNRVVSAAPGGGVGYWSNSHNMNWTGTSWSDSRGGSNARPMQVNCSGNQL